MFQVDLHASYAMGPQQLLTMVDPGSVLPPPIARRPHPFLQMFNLLETMSIPGVGVTPLIN